MQVPMQEEILEIDKKDNIFDEENEEIENENYNTFHNGIQDDGITGVDNGNQDEEEQLVRGRRKKSKNQDTLNPMLSIY